MATKEKAPEISVEARLVHCPCGYHMLTAAPTETARAHNKSKHGGKWKLFDVLEGKFISQSEPKSAPKKEVKSNGGESA